MMTSTKTNILEDFGKSIISLITEKTGLKFSGVLQEKEGIRYVILSVTSDNSDPLKFEKGSPVIIIRPNEGTEKAGKITAHIYFLRPNKKCKEPILTKKIINNLNSKFDANFSL
jgi:hypothetical protein